MILSTHAVVGAAIASLMPNHPALAFVSGIASHFAIDAIPHWDYPLRSILNWRLSGGLALVTLDACAGVAVALWLYASPTTTTAVLLGALGAILPDPLRLAYKLWPREPFRTLQRFHGRIHSKRKLGWAIGVTSQLSFVVLVIAASAALRAVLA